MKRGEEEKTDEQHKLAMPQVSLGPDQPIPLPQRLLQRPVVQCVLVKLVPPRKVERVSRTTRIHELFDVEREGVSDVEV